jgi:tetratricopeptide (TPR) repeat protein
MLGASQMPACSDEAVDQLLSASDKALSDGHIDEAASHARQVLQLDPNNVEGHNQLGFCYVQQHRFDLAAEQFKAALKIDPSYLPGLHNLGSMYYREGSYTKAIESFEEELKKQTSGQGKPSAMILISLADAYRDRARAQPNSPASRVDDQSALSYYKQASGIEPKSALLHNHWGVYYFQQGDLQRAESETRQATELQPDNAAAHYNLALVLEKQGRIHEAADAFRSSLQFENDPQYRRQVADLLTKLGADSARKAQTRDAEMTLQASSSSGIKPAQLPHADYLENAHAALAKGDFHQAEVILRKATASEAKGDAIAWNNLGYALAMQRSLDQAIDCYKQSLKLLPDGFACAQYNLGQAFRQKGDIDKAEKCFNLAIEQAGGMNALAHNALGLCHKQRKQLKDACSEYKLAILQCGDTLPVVHFNLGLALEAQQNNKDSMKLAIAEYERYLQQAPNGLNADAARARLAVLKRG